MKRKVVAIMPETADKVVDGWQYAWQRDFSGGESLAKRPELVKRNQLVKMVNAIISPEGQVTESWQMDKALFVNVTGGIVVTPIPGTQLYTVHTATEAGMMSFTFDPKSPTAYDLADASGYPGYTVKEHANPITIFGISHGTPFLGKNFCCATTDLYSLGDITISPESVAFGTVQVLTANLIELTLTNDTAEVMTLSEASLSGATSGAFGHTGAFPQVLDPAESYKFNIAYNPTVEGANAAVLNIVSTIGVLRVNLSGTAESMMSTTAVNHSFGTINNGQSKTYTFQVANNGPRALTITGIEIAGDNPNLFTSSLATPVVVPAGGHQDVTVTFSPLATGAYFATLSIKADVGNIDGIQLAGAGAVLLRLSPTSALLYGAFVGEWVTANFTVSNISTTETLTITSATLSNPITSIISILALPLNVAPGGTAVITVRFIYPYRGYASGSTLNIGTNWGALSAFLTLRGVG